MRLNRTESTEHDDVSARISRLDVTLFDAIESQSSWWDRMSLLAAQRSVRERIGSYCYLEIGSHLGGSIQTHLLDPRCRRIYSIDKRPPSQPDDRSPGAVFHYPNNSTQRMLDLLESIAPDQMGKIECFDCDASELSRDQIRESPHLCLIDGEHTQQAVLSDWNFCHSVAHCDGMICFHDTSIIRPAIEQIVLQLKAHSSAFEATPLAGEVFAIFLGGRVFDKDQRFRQAVLDTLRDQRRRLRRLDDGQAAILAEHSRRRRIAQAIVPAPLRDLLGSVVRPDRSRG
jgi:hypothetical protein